MSFDHKVIEKKWAKYWDDNNTFFCNTRDFSKPKFYALSMFPYPSAQGLHVGHAEGYSAIDIIARMKRMQGYNVLNPMGWDAFGLPAEQFAIKQNKNPLDFTLANIDNYRIQLKALGMSVDWSKEISTIDPDYYKWTQWIFVQLFLKDLAYVDNRLVNFCPELGTVLANEEVIDGKSERGGYPVIRIPMRQWVLKITEYADRLLEDLKDLDWPESTLEMQRNWIGKSQGTIVKFAVKDSSEQFDVFTTRADTLFGCTYCVLAPEHPLVEKLTTSDRKSAVNQYLSEISHKSDLERTELGKEKTGVFIGSFAINPVNGREVPIYIADYVLATYGSGAVMAVPAHDERDYEFAKKYSLPMIQVLKGDISEAAFTGDAPHINSDFIDGLNIVDSKIKVTEYLISLGKGEFKTVYKLRDWLFSRQRYWGEPIPIIHLDDGKYIAEEHLPLILPELKEYKPSGTGESPLALAKDWLDVEADGVRGRRETNTMPQWAGSCWYHIRYIDPHNKEAIGDKELLKHWLPVDLYIGGSEHAVLHLLYARFWHKFLYDIGVVDSSEPFKKLFHQGMILGENGEKMSKSRGNVVNPDDVIARYGADTLRLYEMFMGPLEASLPWSEGGLDGARRFLDRVFRLVDEEDYKKRISNENDGTLDYIYNYTVKKVTNDFENLQLNTAISQLMIFVNEVYKAPSIYKPYLEGLVKMLSCIAPFIGEEMWQLLGHSETITYAPWPQFDESKLVLDVVTIAVQLNGKLRTTIELARDSDDEIVKKEALSSEIVQKHLTGLNIVKIIVAKNKICNIVAK